MGDYELQIFADRIKQLRNRLNLTQKDFAEKINVTAAALSAYENNQKNPSVSVAKRIANKYNVSIDWLCGLTNKEKTNAKPDSISEILELLFLIDSCVNITIYSHDEEYLELAFSGYPEPSNRIVYEIGFDHYLLNGVIKEWDKMRTLLSDGTIDDEVYSLWKEKTLLKWQLHNTDGSQKNSAKYIDCDAPFETDEAPEQDPTNRPAQN